MAVKVHTLIYKGADGEGENITHMSVSLGLDFRGTYSNTKRKQQTLPLMGATRLASGIFQQPRPASGIKTKVHRQVCNECCL